MKRYIDVDAVLDRLPDDLPYKGSVRRVLMQAPTADVVEVVRCKDCKESEVCPDTLLWCNRNNILVPLNGYCHGGERNKGNV